MPPEAEHTDPQDEPLDLETLDAETLTDDDVDRYIDARRTKAVKDAGESMRVRGPAPDPVEDAAGDLEREHDEAEAEAKGKKKDAKTETAAKDGKAKPGAKAKKETPASDEGKTREELDAEAQAAKDATTEDEGKAKPKGKARKELQSQFQERLAQESTKTAAEKTRADNLQAERDRLAAELEAARAGKASEKTDDKTAPTKKVEAPVPADDPEPQESEIGTKYKRWEDFSRALSLWSGRQAVRQDRAEQAARQETEQATKRTAEQQQAATTQAEYRAQRTVIASADIEAFKADHSDFDKVCANPEAMIHPAMDAAIMELEEGHAAIYYYFGQNPAESKRIAALPPFRQAREIFALATELGAASTDDDDDEDVTDDDEDTGSTPARGTDHRSRIKPIKPVGSRSLSSATPLADETDADRYVARKRATTRPRSRSRR